MVGMAEMKIITSPDDILIALGLGSCVGICAYDKTARIAGLSHVVLPDSSGHEACAGKFANSAVPLLLEAMCSKGATMRNIRIALAGGAQLFSFSGNGPKLEIGLRNATAVQMHLDKLNMTVVASDLGGTVGRTVHLYGDGRVRVKTIGKGEVDLAALGGAPILARAVSK